MAGLAQSLWQGPLTEAEGPAQALTMQDYGATLTGLRRLVGHGLPLAGRLDQALTLWPWSVDLAWLAFEVSRDPAPLARVVSQQRRRFGTLAWALWQVGQVDAALQAVETLDPAAPSHAEDRLARAELRLLTDRPAETLPGPEGLRLDLLATWRQAGGKALARRQDLESAGFPAHSPLWAWLIDVWVIERDFARARAALQGLRQTCGTAHPEVALQTIRLALEAEDPARARAGLDALPADPPWDWPARRHALDLRCRSMAGEDVLERAGAALRLFPRHAGLIAQHRAACEAVQDWDALTDSADAGGLIRLGRADLALARLDLTPVPPDDRFRRALRRAEVHLRLGQVSEADAALPPPPAARPLVADRAWWAAEIALAARDLPRAEAALTEALTHSPTRMGLHLSAARAAFLAGDASRAQSHLTRFRQLKTAQLGHAPPDDLRDRFVADALASSDGPAQSARHFAFATPRFQPLAGTGIPRRIAHYWEGKRSAPVERGLRAWGRLLPQTVFDAALAREWLIRHAPDLTGLFDRQGLPATRADLFRVALLAAEGGVFADLDEFPRKGIEDWLQGASAVLVIEEGHGTIANNFLASLPGLPLFIRLQARIAGNLRATPQPYPWWDSGPAALTIEARSASATSSSLRFLTQPEYDARVATNLPFPHKSGPLHWR